MDLSAVFSPDKPNDVTITPSKRYEQNRDVAEDWDSSRDGSHPGSPMSRSGKRKASDCDRQPESPPEDRHNAPNNWHREKHYRPHQDNMETDSPASYPKHVMVPDERYSRGGSRATYHDAPSSMKQSKPPSTPLLTNDASGGGYQDPMYRSSDYYPNQGQQDGHYRDTHYMDNSMEPSYHHGAQYNYDEPIQEEAYAHGDYRPSRAQYDQATLFHEPSHEGHQVPNRHAVWGSPSRGPMMPNLPQYAHNSRGNQYMGHHYHPNGYQMPPRYPNYRVHNNVHPGHYGNHHQLAQYQNQNKAQQPRMLLAMSTDSDSLSDRQCYVRSEMVEIFAATKKDVTARHSKGAQKLVEGQVGIRCVHCAHLRPRDRAERAVCYPSSISRIYQTVADMQRFHFEQCREIPPEARKVYKTLKTTRPRGVGSPQTYWVQSAKLLDLVDSESGIRFARDLAKEQQEQQEQEKEQQEQQPKQESGVQVDAVN